MIKKVEKIKVFDKFAYGKHDKTIDYLLDDLVVNYHGVGSFDGDVDSIQFKDKSGKIHNVYDNRYIETIIEEK